MPRLFILLIGMLLGSFWNFSISYAGDAFPEVKTEYAKSTATIYDPKTFQKIGTLAKDTAIKPVVVVDNGTPLLHQGRIFVGYTTEDGKKGNGYLNITDFTTTAPATVIEPTKVRIEPEMAIDMFEALKKSYSASCQPGSYQKKTEFDLIEEFHNTKCIAINQDTHNSRGELLLKAWEEFVKEKSNISPQAGELAKKAMTLDLVTRTALFESDYSLGCQAKGSCEKDIILLSIKNRAESPQCNHGNSLFGCKGAKDYIGTATKPSQYNIWMPALTLKTFVTGCFLRHDLQENSMPASQWKNMDGSPNPDLANGYAKRIAMYKDTVKRAKTILEADDKKIQELFQGNPDANKILYYYHPGGMGECNPKNYAESGWVDAAYVKTGNTYKLLRQERIIKTQVSGSVTKFKIYHDKTDPEDLYPGGEISLNNVDFSRNFDCMPLGVNANCNLANPHNVYRKAPKWALNKDQKFASINCKESQDKGASCDQTAKATTDGKYFAGACDPTLSLPLGIH